MLRKKWHKFWESWGSKDRQFSFPTLSFLNLFFQWDLFIQHTLNLSWDTTDVILESKVLNPILPLLMDNFLPYLIQFASEVGYKKIACYRKKTFLVNMMAIYVEIKLFFPWATVKIIFDNITLWIRTGLISIVLLVCWKLIQKAFSFLQTNRPRNKLVKTVIFLSINTWNKQQLQMSVNIGHPHPFEYKPS